jgi:methyl-accepting chemotaxis protein
LNEIVIFQEARMDGGLGVWAVVGMLVFWAAGMTILHISCRKKITSLVQFLGSRDIGENQSMATCHSCSLAALENQILMLVAAGESQGCELREKLASVQTLDRELARNRELGTSLVRDARETGKRVMMNASETLDKGVRSTRAVIDRLDAIIDGAGQRAIDQQGMVQDAASAMEEINASIIQMSENAGQASDAAHQARHESEKGAVLVGQTRDRIDEVSLETGRLEAVLSRLGQRTEEIGAVINLISDIADQTNLLALNAAIEAARAGESGRGFAVVADEVRKLAEKTMAATREVNDKISGIQEGVAETVVTTGRTSRLVGDAKTLAEDSNRVLEQLAGLSSHSHLQMESIATAITQQVAASEEVTRTMSLVDDASVQTAREMELATDQMKALLNQATETAKLLGVFTLLGQGNLQEIMQDVVGSPSVLNGSRDQREEYFRTIVAANPCMELIYLTDTNGVQCISNIPRPGHESSRDARAYGKDWSNRPWFVAATQAQGLVVSDVYESVATGNPCVTVSSVVLHDSRMLGVLAVDVVLG